MALSRFRPVLWLAALFATILAVRPAAAVDGFLLSVHYESEKLGNIHDSATPGKLLRHDLQNDRVVSSRVLYEKQGVSAVCLSPLGDRIAFTKPDGMIALIGVEGGPETDLVSFLGAEQPKAGETPYTALQWPASEGGQWLYYLDGRNGGANNSLRRLNVATRADELVVQLNRAAAGSFALSPDATPHRGKFVKRTDNYVIAIYDLAAGDGDLFNCPRTGGCGESISPDGALLTANDGSHTVVSLVDMAGIKQQEFRLSQWDGDPCRGKPREQIEWAWQSFRWATNALNWISVTQGKLKLGSTHEIYFADAMLYDWVNQRQINVTQNKPGAFDRAAGFWETGSRPALLGYYAGKAPLRVDFHDHRLTPQAKWDFGDGTPAVQGSQVQHAFEREGTYTARAVQGDQAFEARVNVQRRIAPRGTCHFVNDRLLLVDFSEAVQAAASTANIPTAALASGVPVNRVELNQTGRRMLVELGSPLAKNDRLSIAGVTDLAQEPNPLEAKPIEVTIPAWPSNRADLVFLWDNGKTLNAVYDPQAKRVRELRVSRDVGAAGIDRYGRMRFDGGRMSTGFYSQVNAQMQFRELVLADAFSLEVTLQSSDLSQQKPKFPARIVNCSAWHDADWEFFLGQQQDQLMASIRTSANMLSMEGKPVAGDLHGRAPVYEVARLPDTGPHHFILSYVPGRLVAYLDGKQVFESREVTGSLKAWGYGELCFGDNHNGGRHGWLGHLEGVAIYKRFIERAEAEQNAVLMLARAKARRSLPQLEVEAELVAVSKIPTLAEIAPYRDALVINEIVIGKVLKRSPDWSQPGRFEPGQKLRVAQWGLIDGMTTALARAKPGATQRLVLEAYENHPDKLDELETSNSLEDDFDLPLVYEPQP